MTEKIKLPQVVADAIERLRNADLTDYGIVVHVGSDGPNSHSSGDPTERRIIRNWTFGDGGVNADKLLDALRNGYEIEPKFKEGDLVHVSGQKGLYEITCLSGYYADLKGLWGNRAIKNLRHATAEEIAHEKEQRKWAEIKPGDVVISQISGAIAIYEGISPCYREVRVKKHNGAHQFWWNENNIELYAKKVGDE